MYNLGDATENKDLLAPIIGAASGFCLIVFITVIFVYHCKVRKNKKKSLEKSLEPTEENYRMSIQDCYAENYYDSIK